MAAPGRRLRFGRPSASVWDLTYASQEELDDILDMTGAELSGLRIGGYPGTYTTPTLAFTGNAETVTFGVVYGTVRWERPILNGIAKVIFQDMRLTSAVWAENDPAAPVWRLTGTIGEVTWRRNAHRGNIDGDIAYDFDPGAYYPYYASIMVSSYNGSGGITALEIPETNKSVAGLLPDQTGVALSGAASASGTGFAGTVDIVGGELVNAAVTSPGSGYGGDQVSIPVTFAGQQRMIAYLPDCFAQFGVCDLQGPFTFDGNTYSLLCHGLKGMTPSGAITITNNHFDMSYSDCIALGQSDNAPGDVLIEGNLFTRTFCGLDDPGDPHGDLIQGFMSGTMLSNWRWTIRANVAMTGPASRGIDQGIFLTNPANVAYTGYVAGNLLLNRTQSNGLCISATYELFVYGNDSLRYDYTESGNTGAVNLRGNDTASQIGLDTFYGANIAESFSGIPVQDGVDPTSVPNLFLGTLGAAIPYTSVLAGPADNPGTRAAAAAAFLSLAPYTGFGASRPDGYVNFVTGAVDVELEPTVVNFTTDAGAATSTLRTSNASLVMGGPETVTISLSGAAGSKEWRVADDRAMTSNPTAWTAADGSFANGKYLQVRGDSSAAAASSVQVIATLNGHANAFTITTASVASFAAVANGGTAYSTWPAISPNETGLRKLVIVHRRAILVPASGDTLWGRGSTCNTDQSLANGIHLLNLTIGGSSIVTVTVEGDSLDMHTHFVSVDLTKASIFAGGLQWWRDDRELLISQGSFDSQNGGRTLTTNTLFGTSSPAAGMCARGSGGSTISNVEVEFFWMHWSSDTNFVVPDFSDPGARALWLADNIGADGSGPLGGTQPKIYWTGANAAAWDGGLANLGSLTLPLTKAASNYTDA